MRKPSELTKLKRELAALQKQVEKQQRWIDDLKPFLSIQKYEQKPNLHLECSQITLRDVNYSDKWQAFFATHEDGPFLWMQDRNESIRIILEVKEDAAGIDVQSKERKRAISLDVGRDGLGVVGVLANGSPRAVMKATTNDTGAVSVVHDDGKVRVCMSSSDHEGGEVLLITPDMKTGVKLTSGLEQGGGVFVNHDNGKNGIALFCTKETGIVLASDHKGRPKAALPEP